MNDNTIYGIWLQDIFGEESTKAVGLIKKHGSPEKIFGYDEGYIKGMGLPAKYEAGLLKKDLSRAEEILSVCVSRGYTVLTPCEKEYPDGLRALPDMPLALYCRGNVPDFNKGIFISSVGKRECSLKGAKTAYRICSELSSAGACIVSGMAAGIDYCSHYGALDASGFTVAVLGCGVDVLYPSRNEKLRDNIALHGLIMSEYPPGKRPTKTSFPARNRIVACLSLGTVVIDATIKSGSLITARYAKLYGKRVFAVPSSGGIFGEGTDKLIENGAYSVMSGEDIAEIINKKYPGSLNIERLRMQRDLNENYPEEAERAAVYASGSADADTGNTAGRTASDKGKSSAGEGLEGDEREIYLCLTSPKTPEMIAADIYNSTGKSIDMGDIFCALTALEANGLISQCAGGTYKII